MRFTVNAEQFPIRLQRDGSAFAVMTVGDPHDQLTRDTALLYAEEMIEALQRRFGTAEPVVPENATFFGIAIPPALEEVAPLLLAAELLDPTKRTKPMVDAIGRFIEYCDAEGIVLPRKPPEVPLLLDEPATTAPGEAARLAPIVELLRAGAVTYVARPPRFTLYPPTTIAPDVDDAGSGP